MCPSGFREGFIKWDDKDFRNKNEHKGELPEGKYDDNTMINFCCHSGNGNPTDPIQLLTEKPFVLYRYGRECQKVMGMRVVEDYILWNDEFVFNKDETGGSFHMMMAAIRNTSFTTVTIVHTVTTKSLKIKIKLDVCVL